jgi:hypothetical protein
VIRLRANFLRKGFVAANETITPLKMASEDQLNEAGPTSQMTRAKTENLIHSRLVHLDDERSLSAQFAYCD